MFVINKTERYKQESLNGMTCDTYKGVEEKIKVETEVMNKYEDGILYLATAERIAREKDKQAVLMGMHRSINQLRKKHAAARDNLRNLIVQRDGLQMRMLP